MHILFMYVHVHTYMSMHACTHCTCLRVCGHHIVCMLCMFTCMFGSILLVCCGGAYLCSETSLIRHLYNPTFLSNSTIIYGRVTIRSDQYGKRHSIIQQPLNLTLFPGPIECRIREVSLYLQLGIVHIPRLCTQ